MSYGKLVLVLMLLMSSTAQARQTPAVRLSRLSFRSFTGRYVPVGEQRRDFKSARTHGVQAAIELAPFVRILGSTSWTDGQSRNLVLRLFPKTRIWQYDLGAEFPSRTVELWLFDFKPFVGAGAGARNYYYPDKGLASKVYPAGYYAVGSELQAGPVGLRIETRAYLSFYRAPLEPAGFYRDDLSATVGLTYRVF